MLINRIIIIWGEVRRRRWLPEIPQIAGVLLFIFLAWLVIGVTIDYQHGHINNEVDILFIIFCLSFIFLSSVGLMLRRKWGCIGSIILWFLLFIAHFMGFINDFNGCRDAACRKMVLSFNKDYALVYLLSFSAIIYSFYRHWKNYRWK
jgi:hypothetical protein